MAQLALEGKLVYPYTSINIGTQRYLTIRNLPSSEYLTYPAIIGAIGDHVDITCLGEMMKWPEIMYKDGEEIGVWCTARLANQLLNLEKPISLGGKDLILVCCV